MTHRKWSDEIRRKAVELYVSGLTAKQVAIQMNGPSLPQVTKWAKRAGVTRPYGPTKYDDVIKRDTEKHGNCELSMDMISAWVGLGLGLFDVIEPEDFNLINYTHEKPIKVDMLAPKSV